MKKSVLFLGLVLVLTIMSCDNQLIDEDFPIPKEVEEGGEIVEGENPIKQGTNNGGMASNGSPSKSNPGDGGNPKETGGISVDSGIPNPGNEGNVGSGAGGEYSPLGHPEGAGDNGGTETNPITAGASGEEEESSTTNEEDGETEASQPQPLPPTTETEEEGEEVEIGAGGSTPIKEDKSLILVSGPGYQIEAFYQQWNDKPDEFLNTEVHATLNTWEGILADMVSWNYAINWLNENAAYTMEEYNLLMEWWTRSLN
jgi:hypothetical protein